MPAMYAAFDFGLHAAADEARSVRYGFQLNYATLHSDVPATHVMQVDFNRNGLAALSLGGIQLALTSRVLQENGDAPVAGEPSTGEQIGSVFKGIGFGTGAVILAGGVAVALIVASGGGGETEVNGVPRNGDGNPDYCIGEIPPAIGNGCIISGSTFSSVDRGDAAVDRVLDAEYQRWLEARHGQMGDLLAD